MKEEMIKILKNQNYLIELLSKNTLEEIVEFFKLKNVEINLDDAKEFVELIKCVEKKANKSKSGKIELNDEELINTAGGGALISSIVGIAISVPIGCLIGGAVYKYNSKKEKERNYLPY